MMQVTRQVSSATAKNAAHYDQSRDSITALAARFLFYYAFVYPHLMYGIEIYANTFITYLDNLVKINNKLRRILQNHGVLASEG